MLNSSFVRRALMLCATMVLLPHHAALAQTATKTVTWTIKEAPPSGTMNKYSWSLTAKAVQPPNAAATENNPSPSGDFASANWDATAALAATSQTTDTAVSGGAQSVVSETFSATAPTPVDGGLFQVQTSMKDNAVLVTPSGATTSVIATGYMKLDSGLVTGATITKKGDKAQAIPQANLAGQARFSLYQGTFNDPIDIGIYDASDDLIASQHIGAINLSSNASGAVEWDDGGLSLAAPTDGSSSASITADVGNSDGNGDYADSWVTDSYVGFSSVSLSNGVFTATGLFADLPWQLNNPTSPTSATLAPQYLSELDLDYQIPSSLVNPGDEYYEQLTSEESLAIEEAVPAPEPASLALVACIGLIGRRRHR